MVVLFDKSFSTGKMPEKWSRGIIKNLKIILKNTKADFHDPKNNRGISITSFVHKLY